jgi:triacylglycerol lipase
MGGQMNTPRPVVLLHGIWDSSRAFAHLAARLRTGGFLPLAVDLTPSDGTAGLDELARQVAEFVGRHLAAETTFDLVGFSMGGLVGRYYVQRLGGAERVGRLITISAPHRGTYMAYASRNRGSRQMRPGSAFLRELNRDTALLGRVRVASIWTPMDLMIVPAVSSRLGVGDQFRIPVAAHPLMLRSRRSLELVERLLREPPPPDSSVSA